MKQTNPAMAAAAAIELMYRVFTRLAPVYL
jgi:hypothetical protein